MHDLVHIDAVAIRQLLEITISALKQVYHITIPSGSICNTCNSKFPISFSFSFRKQRDPSTVMHTHRVHEHLVLLVLFRVQHVVTLLAKSDAHESRTVVVRVVARYFRHDCANSVYPSFGVSVSRSPAISNVRRENDNNNVARDGGLIGAPSAGTFEKQDRFTRRGAPFTHGRCLIINLSKLERFIIRFIYLFKRFIVRFFVSSLKIWKFIIPEMTHKRLVESS